MSAAAALGREAALVREIRGAIAAGAPVERIQETLLQIYLFAGFPRAINALAVLHTVVGVSPREEGPRPGDRRLRGEKLCRRIYGDDYLKMLSYMRLFHPDLADWILEEGYGKVLSRPALPIRTRELIIVGTLAACGIWRQLPSHARGALRVGATRPQVIAAIDAVGGLVKRGHLVRAKRAAGLYSRSDLGSDAP